MSYGPTLKISQQIHQEKYRLPGEDFQGAMNRVAGALSENSTQEQVLRDILLNQRFLPAGRIQTGAGTTKAVTLYNCFVSGDIDDNFTGRNGIMQRATDAAETMRRGGGVGYNFSTLRPRNDTINSLGSPASGPVSFMHIYDAVCKTVSSAGHRRGAQMGVLRVDHPDIEEFIEAKQNDHSLTAFNISVGITDGFMGHLHSSEPFPLKFNGKVHSMVSARDLWDRIMHSTWDYAEPGVIFIDQINRMNNLWYCENISSTNPCSEQPLPAHGACLLGSFNLVSYLKWDAEGSRWAFHWARYIDDIRHVVRAMDNVVDISMYPLVEQKDEAQSKRRMGLGITGFANTSEVLGYPYGSKDSLRLLEGILRTLRDMTYEVSTDLAKEKGAFPLFDKEKYLKGSYIETLPQHIRDRIYENGIRNSHLTSLAPCGTISLTSDNVSSGIEPVFSHGYERTINMPSGKITEFFSDYAARKYKVFGKTANELTAQEHLEVLQVSQKYIDSAVSKTCNVNPNMPWEDFKMLYWNAWNSGCKGLSTFNVGGKRMGIMKASAPKETLDDEQEGLACYINAETGEKTCG